MKTICEKCGAEVEWHGLGRRPLSIPVSKVIDAIRSGKTKAEAAKMLGCSRAYIYQVVKQVAKEVWEA